MVSFHQPESSDHEDKAMTEKEKMESYIATCKCCLLAETMKTCPICLFNIGLAEKINSVELIPLPILAPVSMFAMSD
jgi:hypothetical protein